MTIKTKLGVTLSAAALTFAGLAAGLDMGNVDCVAKLQPKDVAGTMPVTGYLMHSYWGTDLFFGEGLDISVEIPIPAKLPGFANLADAMRNTVLVTMTRGKTVYAECTVNANPVVTQKGLLEFAMMVRQDGDLLKWHGGLCDIEPWVDGIQPGVPTAYDGDWVRVYTMEKGIKTPVTEGWVAVL